MNTFRDSNLSPEVRAQLLLSEMTTEEKLFQLQSQLLFPNEYDSKRDFRAGCVRNPGHFMHVKGEVAPSVAAQAINDDTRKSIEASRFGIPVLQNGEALHGAEWCSATCFPQAIAMAATFDPELVRRIARAVGKELRAGGVRQVFAPVVNITRDCRWGRTEESYGEDVLLTSQMGAAYSGGLEDENVVATPKHFVDNYSDGGRDSNESHSSWRELREVYLEPFRACFQEGHARSTMLAYNSVDGVPCSCNETLMKRILREEWGFKGFTVSDYGGVEGVSGAHKVARDLTHAQADCLKAGMDFDLPNGGACLKEAYKQGLFTEEDLNSAVLHILTAKFELGLFEEPYVDAAKADQIVHAPEHMDLALEGARKCMVLLKNDGLLPLKKGAHKRIGLFGPSANTVNIGGYSGPFGGWNGQADTPFDAIRAYCKGEAEVVLCEPGDDVRKLSETCDLAIYFTATLEGEGSDRCSFRLPAQRVKKRVSEGSAMIVDEKETVISVDQEAELASLSSGKTPLMVVLINGAPIDVSGWENGAHAILEAWYPGEKGSQALAETLFGENNPGGKLPITFPRSIGQAPLFYARKPSGRGYGYVENDGSPRWPFGFGMSYTAFEWSQFEVLKADAEGVLVSLNVKNTGNVDGDEVVQLYLGQTCADVVRPLKEMKAFSRVFVPAGETRRVELKLGVRELSFWNREMKFGLHPCHCRIVLGAHAEDEQFAYEFELIP